MVANFLFGRGNLMEGQSFSKCSLAGNRRCYMRGPAGIIVALAEEL